MRAPLAELLLVVLSAVGAAPWWPSARPSSPWCLRALRRLPRRAGSPRDGPRSRAAERPAVDPAVLLDLAGAALDAGASIPRALAALADALDGAGAGGGESAALRLAASTLMLGGSWQEAWGAAPTRLRVLAVALEPAWVDGVGAGPLLSRAADRLRAGQARAAEEAAARLGVRLVLPLGLCFLPSFVLLGLVPVVLSAGAGLFG